MGAELARHAKGWFVRPIRRSPAPAVDERRLVALAGGGLKTTFEGASIQVVPGAGHTLMIERATETLEALASVM